jgi:hypothetical protein
LAVAFDRERIMELVRTIDFLKRRKAAFREDICRYERLCLVLRNGGHRRYSSIQDSKEPMQLSHQRPEGRCIEYKCADHEHQ